MKADGKKELLKKVGKVKIKKIGDNDGIKEVRIKIVKPRMKMEKLKQLTMNYWQSLPAICKSSSTTT